MASEEDALLNSAIAASAVEKNVLEALFADTIASLAVRQRRCPDGHGTTAGICDAGVVCSTCLADTSLAPGVMCSAKRCGFIACAICLLENLNVADEKSPGEHIQAGLAPTLMPHDTSAVTAA